MQAAAFRGYDTTAGKAGRQPLQQIRVMHATATDENFVDIRHVFQNCGRNRARTQLRERRLYINCWGRGPAKR